MFRQVVFATVWIWKFGGLWDDAAYSRGSKTRCALSSDPISSGLCVCYVSVLPEVFSQDLTAAFRSCAFGYLGTLSSEGEATQSELSRCIIDSILADTHSRREFISCHESLNFLTIGRAPGIVIAYDIIVGWQPLLPSVPLSALGATIAVLPCEGVPHPPAAPCT